MDRLVRLQNAAIRLSLDGPKVIDIKSTMTQAVKLGVFKTESSPKH